MEITAFLGEMRGPRSVARELCTSERQAASSAAELLPALLSGFRSQAQAHHSGLAGLADMLDDILGMAGK